MANANIEAVVATTAHRHLQQEPRTPRARFGPHPRRRLRRGSALGRRHRRPQDHHPYPPLRCRPQHHLRPQHRRRRERQGDDRRLAERAHQGQAPAHRLQAHRNGPRRCASACPCSFWAPAEGVKTQGGVLSQVLHEVEIECLPGNIPGHIDVDISKLAMNGYIHISDLPHADNIKFLGEENAVVAHVSPPREEAAAEVVTVAEPEVAKKGKQDAAADAAAAPAKK